MCGGQGGAPADIVITSTPVSVTQTVCSHCAERLRSLVTMVQPSGNSEIAAVPGVGPKVAAQIARGLKGAP